MTNRTDGLFGKSARFLYSMMEIGFAFSALEVGAGGQALRGALQLVQNSKNGNAPQTPASQPN